jgi:acetyl esterase
LASAVGIKKSEDQSMLDNASQALVSQLSALGAPPLNEMTPDEARAFTASMSPSFEDAIIPDSITVRDVSIEVSGGVIHVHVFAPRGRINGLIVYFPGGGWVQNTAGSAVPAVIELIESTGCALVEVEYRLAPEYRFPTAADDAFTALQWAAAHMEEIADGPVPLIVAGESAGGNLAAVAAGRSVGRQGPHVDAQVLFYPVTDADFET